MKYVLARTYNSKNAKRHIVMRDTLESIEKWVDAVKVSASDKYTYCLYTNKWELVKSYN